MEGEGVGKYAYKVDHVFKYKFFDVATAFWCKYKEANSYNTITIADIKQEDDNKFTFVRRMDGGDGKVEYEKITYEREQLKIVADLFMYDNSLKKRALSERCVYGWDSMKGACDYSLIVIKEKWCRFIRTKGFQWGISKMEDLLKKTAQDAKNASI